MVALHRIVCAFCVFTTVASSGPGWAQSFGQQPPAPSGLGFGQGQGATPSPGYGQSLPAPSPAFLAGTWSGQFQDQSGTIHGTTGFGSDGSFVMVVQLPNQVLERVWGRYQVAAAGPSQSKVDYQVEGWLPRTFCTQVQAPGAPLNCQPVRVPSTITAEFRITSQSTMIDDKNVTLIRDPSPYLLQQQIPEQVVIAVAAPVQPFVTPVLPLPPSPYGGGGSRPATNIPGLGGNCDDLQQQRICAIRNGGRLVTSGGCLKCI